MLYPLLILAVASVFFASCTYDLILGLGSSLYLNALFTHPNHLSIIDAEYLPFFLKALPALPLFFLLT
jgi:NADH-ubiquinone oxidoreductase chain 5